MSLTGNFGVATLENGSLTVSGSSSGMEDGELISRYVAVHQAGGDPVKGPATLGLKWQADGLEAPSLKTGDALAVGVETYFTSNTDALPAFATFTWSQVIEIAKA
jgi:hypothetical protein